MIKCKTTHTLKECIEETMKEYFETFEDIESCSLSEEELQKQEESLYYLDETPFLIHTKNYVYFPVINKANGYTSVQAVPRNPNGSSLILLP